MAKITDLVEQAAPGDSNVLPIDDGIETKKIQLFNIVSAKQKAWLKANGFDYADALVCAHGLLPNNYAVADKNGNYNWMVEIPRKNWDSANGFAATTIHPAFTVGGVQKRIMIGKYIASARSANVPQSMPNKIPVASQTFDQQLTDCNNLNGSGITGWHLMTNPEWALVAQISKNIGVTVYGNNNYGRDVDDKSVTFRLNDPTLFGGASGNAWSFTGSGGVKSSHNGQLDGIFDLNGNVWERISGLRLNNGEINVFVDNNCADSTADFSAGSANWKAILRDGSLVAPGTANTLKLDASGNISTSTGGTTGSHAFETFSLVAPVVAGDAGVELLKKLLIYPYTSGLGSDQFYFNNGIEAIAIRGGYWNDGSAAGLFVLGLRSLRSYADYFVGFRLAFVL